MQEGSYAAEIKRREEVLRRKRRLEKVYRRRRLRLALGFAVLCLMVAGVIIAATAGGATEKVSADTLLVGGARSESAPIAADVEGYPAFARFGDRNILLPVEAGDATIIAYQSISDDRAVTLTPIGDQANANALVRFFRAVFASKPAVRYYVIDGSPGREMTSVLVGASVGAPVLSPVTGVVTGVKEYLLHGKYPDVRIDIRPEKSSGTTLTLLFISDPVVSMGETVTAGKTKLGKVRECPEELGATVAVHTHDAGSHVHLQITEEPVN
ncbi:MAG: M23 family metallopeptidase [Actinobacteria bacterium]|jgi:hypothetical protein|nr:M23 family metallopeptidase [Actinomycetota bacterium]